MSNKFNNDLADLMERYTRKAIDSQSHEMQAEMMERLVHALGVCIATFCMGDRRAMNEILIGIESQLANEVAATANAMDAITDMARSTGGKPN